MNKIATSSKRDIKIRKSSSAFFPDISPGGQDGRGYFLTFCTLIRVKHRTETPARELKLFQFKVFAGPDFHAAAADQTGIFIALNNVANLSAALRILPLYRLNPYMEFVFV